jgi:tRNA pseudouridine38/39 synthase
MGKKKCGGAGGASGASGASGAGTGKRKAERAFDFSRCSSRQVALQISYVGWDYKGFASQDDSDETIEGHLFAALTKTCLIQSRATSRYSRCARHKFSQVKAP